jgi:AcrR family transcriptional regulator
MSNIHKKQPGRPRSIQSHQAMLQATLELLAEVGFEGMSIEAIAARAEIGKTTIYRRYASKEERAHLTVVGGVNLPRRNMRK